MDKNKSIRILLGLIGGFVLICFNTPQLQTALIYLMGRFTQILFALFSIVGAIVVLSCSLWLIADALKAIIKK